MEVSYPGGETVTLHIIKDNYIEACNGATNMQASIARQYAAIAKPGPGWRWSWAWFSFTPVGPVVPPTPGVKKPTKRPETYGCTCERDCASCEQGWHKSCSYGCKHGQVVQN